MIYALLTFMIWGIADLYYKKGNAKESKYNHLKTGIIVGVVMGTHATIFLLTNKIDLDIIVMLEYLPVSICYILSMIIGYKGLKYIELSISSPIQNSSGIITSILLCLIFKLVLSKLEILGILIIFIGLLTLSIIEVKENKQEKVVTKLKLQAIVFPLIYALIDGLGTFLDAIYLDQLEIINEDLALISYEYTFLLYGLIIYLYLSKVKKEELHLFKEKDKIKASIFETFGQFTYVFALASNSILAIPIVASYSVLSVLLSRIFLKEKLPLLKYVGIILIFIGIITLSIVECL